jgi:hypothetical protein
MHSTPDPREVLAARRRPAATIFAHSTPTATMNEPLSSPRLTVTLDSAQVGYLAEAADVCEDTDAGIVIDILEEFGRAPVSHPADIAAGLPHGLHVAVCERWHRSLLSVADTGESNWPHRSNDFYLLRRAIENAAPVAA